MVVDKSYYLRRWKVKWVEPPGANIPVGEEFAISDGGGDLVAFRFPPTSELAIRIPKGRFQNGKLSGLVSGEGLRLEVETDGRVGPRCIKCTVGKRRARTDQTVGQFGAEEEV